MNMVSSTRHIEACMQMSPVFTQHGTCDYKQWLMLTGLLPLMPNVGP